MVDCGHVTPDAGCGRGCHSGDCGHMTPGSGSGKGCHNGDYGHVTLGIGSGRGSPWRLWICEPRCRVWEVG